MTRLWWQADPGLLEREKHALDEAGIDWRLDEEYLKREEAVRLHLRTIVKGRPFELRADYPDLFPYLKPEVFTEHRLPRHREPFSGRLCLVGRAEIGWSSSMTLAELLNRQLENTITAAEGTQEEAARLEEPQGEPFSAYYPYAQGVGLIVESAWDLAGADGGTFTARVDVRQAETDGDVLGLRGAVAQVRNRKGQVLAEADEKVTRLFREELEGVWQRLAEPIMESDPQQFGEALLGPRKDWYKHLVQIVDGRRVVLAAAVFPEEVRQFEREDGWAFLAAFSKGNKRRPDKPLPPPRKPYFIPALRAGDADVAARVPQLEPLRDATVTVIGVGGIGAPVAIELAKAGVGELVLVDHDTVDPAGSVRWPLGFRYAGMTKGSALAGWINDNHPRTKARHEPCRIGIRSDASGGERADEAVVRLLQNTDGVFDGTAEWNVQHALSDFARHAGLPYVYAHTTYGAWGGFLARLLPGSTCCWSCLQHYISEGIVPRPPNDPGGHVQPTGCGDPTFTGTGFDVAAVSMESTRLLIATLCQGTRHAYPNATWDVAVARFRDRANGDLLPTSWETFTIPPVQGCQVCSR